LREILKIIHWILSAMGGRATLAREFETVMRRALCCSDGIGLAAF
jgi:hypothetical protein